MRVSRRARHVNLHYTPRQGLEVVIPHGFDRTRIPDILHEKRHWISRVGRRYSTDAQAADDALPEEIRLRAIGETWRVLYAPRGAAPEPRLLVIRAATEDRDRAVALLRQALRRLAEAHLVPWLTRLSAEHRLPYRRATVRSQRGLWGSCTSRQAISLNFKLLFLPEPLTRYVLLHELAHTRHLDHSPRYWALVAAIEPGYREAEAGLRDAWRHVPAWAG